MDDSFNMMTRALYFCQQAPDNYYISKNTIYIYRTQQAVEVLVTSMNINHEVFILDTSNIPEQAVNDLHYALYKKTETMPGASFHLLIKVLLKSGYAVTGCYEMAIMEIEQLPEMLLTNDYPESVTLNWLNDEPMHKRSANPQPPKSAQFHSQSMHTVDITDEILHHLNSCSSSDDSPSTNTIETFSRFDSALPMSPRDLFKTPKPSILTRTVQIQKTPNLLAGKSSAQPYMRSNMPPSMQTRTIDNHSFRRSAIPTSSIPTSAMLKHMQPSFGSQLTPMETNDSDPHLENRKRLLKRTFCRENPKEGFWEDGTYWTYLGEGTYNYAYKNQKGYVLKKAKNNLQPMDIPERSVRVYNELNPTVPQAFLKDGHWQSIFIGQKLIDPDIKAKFALQTYRDTGRIILDVYCKDNVLYSEEYKTPVCIDPGNAVKRQSITSETFWYAQSEKALATRKVYREHMLGCIDAYHHRKEPNQSRPILMTLALIFIDYRITPVRDVTIFLEDYCYKNLLSFGIILYFFYRFVQKNTGKSPFILHSPTIDYILNYRKQNNLTVNDTINAFFMKNNAIELNAYMNHLNRSFAGHTPLNHSAQPVY
jgi:hypothetical protein